jgi:hypothetical protein
MTEIDDLSVHICLIFPSDGKDRQTAHKIFTIVLHIQT